METKKQLKPLHTYKVEFIEYGRYATQEVNFTAYSPKQAKKFFYDWWKNHHTSYATVILVSQLDDAYAKRLTMQTTGETVEERFKRQSDYIYRREQQ